MNAKVNNSYESSEEEFSQYLNLKGTQFGYLYEIREIPNTNPAVFQAVIKVPNGKGENIDHPRFQATIKDAQSLSLLLQHKDAIHAKDDVFAKISFACYGLTFNPYIIQKGDRKGEAAVSIGTNLSAITYLSLNDEVLYHSKKPDDVEDSESVSE